MCIPPRTGDCLAELREINEAVLAAVWNEQAPLRGPMWDCLGNSVAVVYRGRWTAGLGPDFEGAMLELGSATGARLATGSVEMHLRCADWYEHGHHTDPRYNSVILHVVLWPVGARPVTRADGASVPTLVLADYITVTSAELLATTSRALPNMGALGEEPCWQRTEQQPLDTLLARIDAAGDERLFARAGSLEAELEIVPSPDELLYRGLMDALGYSANREPMRALADALPLSQLLTLPLTQDISERISLLESVFLGAGGLLPSQRPGLGALDWLSSQYATEIEEVWNASAPAVGAAPGEPLVSGWNMERVRPANAPPRRLAAAARLLARLLWEPGGMLGTFLRHKQNPLATAREWIAVLEVPPEGYWASHSDFGVRLAAPVQDKEEIALVGSARAADIAVNVILPLLLASAAREDDPGGTEAALGVYASFPKLAENRITRAMAKEVLGPRAGKAINTARRQQGLIHLYKLYCETRRCYDCPIGKMHPRM